MTKERSFSVRARLRSFRFAARGLGVMLTSQHNAWIHAVLTVVAVGLGVWTRLERVEWCLLVVAIVSVWTAESLNTAFEFLCDVASPELHPLVERCKDVAAGAVLCCSIGALVVGGLLFGPALLKLI
jgi:diacylglycerol kinase (ATP)